MQLVCIFRNERLLYSNSHYFQFRLTTDRMPALLTLCHFFYFILIQTQHFLKEVDKHVGSNSKTQHRAPSCKVTHLKKKHPVPERWEEEEQEEKDEEEEEEEGGANRNPAVSLIDGRFVQSETAGICRAVSRKRSSTEATWWEEPLLSSSRPTLHPQLSDQTPPVGLWEEGVRQLGSQSFCRAE